MIVFLGVFSSIALLALIVYALHKFQQKEKEESVDRSSPLPPLPSHQLAGDEPAVHSGALARDDWQSVVKTLKESGNFNQALDVCKAALPQLAAFKQACVLLRGEIREAKRGSQNPESFLADLYKLSAMAAFFHEKLPNCPPISALALKKVRYSEFSNLPMPYKDLGYAYLKLLTPTDVQMLEQLWGSPSGHQHVREFHIVAWQQVLTSSNSK